MSNEIDIDIWIKKINFEFDVVLKQLSDKYRCKIINIAPVDYYEEIKQKTEAILNISANICKRTEILNTELDQIIDQSKIKYEIEKGIDYVQKSKNSGYLIYSDMVKKSMKKDDVRSNDIRSNDVQKSNVIQTKDDTQKGNLDKINTPRKNEVNTSKFVSQKPISSLILQNIEDIENRKKSDNTYVPINFNIPELSYTIKLNKVKSLKDIPSMFYYYEGDKKNPPGVYCSFRDTYMKIPFPEIIDSTKDQSRVRSIRCKYNTKEMCEQMSQKYNYKNKMCYYAHTGEKITKIGYNSRCSIANFGNPSDFERNIKYVGLNDVKSLLLYGLNDVFISALCIDYNKYSGGGFSHLDEA